MTRAAVLGLALAAATAAGGPQEPGPPDIRFEDAVDVERVVIDARVVDGEGRPVLGLGPRDFRVRVDGREVAVESVEWIPAHEPAAVAVSEDGGVTVTADPAKTLAAALPESEGRLIVLFFQKDFDRSRLPGLLRMQEEMRRFVRALPAADRVAVVSFDSHLKAWRDFTRDRDRLDRTIESWILSRDVTPVPEDPPSLLAAWDDRRARDAASPEAALHVLADALAPIAGPKTVVMIGYGMGRFSSTGVTMVPEYDRARRALAAARATVFALDVTEADSHSLEAGLIAVAEDTGGFYARTHVFSGAALARLEQALAGHYVLTFVRPDLPKGEHRLEVRLQGGRRGTVLAKSTWVG